MKNLNPKIKLRVLIISLLIFFIWLQCHSTKAWIVIVPENTSMELIPHSTNIKNVLQWPWTASLDIQKNIMGIEIVHLKTRVPLSTYNDYCVTLDQTIIPQPCPYPVKMSVKMPEAFQLSNIFELMLELHHWYPEVLTKIELAKGGTVMVAIPHYHIILGRKHLFNRLKFAKKAITSSGLLDKEGQLDMRYNDGLAFYPGRNLL